MKKLALVLTSLLAVSFIIILLVIPRGDERQIRRNLASLAAMVSKSGSENEIMALVGARKIKPLFTQDCRVVVGDPFPEIQGHNMLVSTVYQARKMVKRVDVDFHDISVIIGENHITAITTMTATATGPDPQEGKRVIEAQEVEMRWKKVEGAWKIAEIQLIETLR